MWYDFVDWRPTLDEPNTTSILLETFRVSFIPILDNTEVEEYFKSRCDFGNLESTSVESDINNIPLKTFNNSTIPATDNTEEEYKKLWNNFPDWETVPTEPDTTRIPLRTSSVSSIPTHDNTEAEYSFSPSTLLESKMYNQDEEGASLSVFKEPAKHGKRIDLIHTSESSFSVDDFSVHMKPIKLALPAGKARLNKLYDDNTISKITHWLSLYNKRREKIIKSLYDEALIRRYITIKLFNRQFTNFMYQKVFSSDVPTVSEARLNIKKVLILNNITLIMIYSRIHLLNQLISFVKIKLFLINNN